MTQLTQEEIRDEVLSVFEDSEHVLQRFSDQINQIESEAVMLFERRTISIKNSLINDENISDDDLEKEYLDAIAKLKDQILLDTKERIEKLTVSLKENPIS